MSIKNKYDSVVENPTSFSFTIDSENTASFIRGKVCPKIVSKKKRGIGLRCMSDECTTCNRAAFERSIVQHILRQISQWPEWLSTY